MKAKEWFYRMGQRACRFHPSKGRIQSSQSMLGVKYEKLPKFAQMAYSNGWLDEWLSEVIQGSQQ